LDVICICLSIDVLWRRICREVATTTAATTTAATTTVAADPKQLLCVSYRDVRSQDIRCSVVETEVCLDTSPQHPTLATSVRRLDVGRHQCAAPFIRNMWFGFWMLGIWICRWPLGSSFPVDENGTDFPLSYRYCSSAVWVA
jgi:hypothetical protein